MGGGDLGVVRLGQVDPAQALGQAEVVRGGVSLAKAMGRDRYGLWADIRIQASGAGGVIQRLRWIPPGRFQYVTDPDGNSIGLFEPAKG